jgi:hypothetical protein
VLPDRGVPMIRIGGYASRPGSPPRVSYRSSARLTIRNERAAATAGI